MTRRLALASALVTIAACGAPQAAAVSMTTLDDGEVTRGPFDYDAKEAAAYLDAMHKRMHPFYAVRELGALDKKPANDPANDREAYAVLFMTIDESGKLLDVNMVKGTGVVELNMAIRHALKDASPFPKPPASILSRDKKARVRWQFHRDPKKECQPTHAWPMIVEPS